MKPKIGITSSIRTINHPSLKLSVKRDYLSLSMSYVNAIVKAGGVPLVLPVVVELIDEFLEAVDGLLLSGGGDIDSQFYNEKPSKWLKNVNPLRDSFELELVRRATRMKIPILGICRGIQVINVALGGTLIQDIKSEIRSSIVHDLTKVSDDFKAHSVKIDPNSKLAQILGVRELTVNSFHHQAIKRLGKGLKAVARAPDGVIEAVESTSHGYVVGVQWHPERMLDNIQLKLFRSLIDSSSS